MSPGVSRVVCTGSVWLKLVLLCLWRWFVAAEVLGWGSLITGCQPQPGFPFLSPSLAKLQKQISKTSWARKSKPPANCSEIKTKTKPKQNHHQQTQKPTKKSQLEIWKYPWLCWARFSGLSRCIVVYNWRYLKRLEQYTLWCNFPPTEIDVNLQGPVAVSLSCWQPQPYELFPVLYTQSWRLACLWGWQQVWCHETCLSPVENTVGLCPHVTKPSWSNLLT